MEIKDWADIVFGLADPLDFRASERLDEICEADTETFLRLTEIFNDPADILASYSDEAIGQAFWDLSFAAFYGVYDSAIDWAVRERFIKSFEPLFRKLLAARCERAFRSGSGLNIACYMWWDFDCWHATPDPLTRNPYDVAFLDSMRSILAINHIACQESALHGLGHWHRVHPAEVENIIDEYVDNNPGLGPDLREYANAARCGCVQ